MRPQRVNGEGEKTLAEYARGAGGCSGISWGQRGELTGPLWRRGLQRGGVLTKSVHDPFGLMPRFTGDPQRVIRLRKNILP